jgi:hypothetical protein
MGKETSKSKGRVRIRKLRVKGKEERIEKRNSLSATGGKDLGKLKSVAIDYLTGERGREADFGS